ncbi:MAG: ABC transporter ATP-binding protein [Bacteroidia bacterium]|jgi:ABC-2 type transport system ATP-binding protein|nr:ABC transporter ATP-binding protein [Bacteroidia bacterium]
MAVLTVEEVTKRYANHVALRKINLSVDKGRIFGLLGPNGAGKTSLIRIITQITQPDSGNVYLNDEKLKPEHVYKIGYLPEERGLYKKMEVGEQLLYFARLKGLQQSEAKRRIKDWVVKFEIESWWNKKVEELSKGMQQKIQFIATVVHQPELIILDEPFSGFDPINAELITKEILQLKEQGTTIIFSTHRMESVEQLCDDIALINKSEKILSGNINDIRKQFSSNTFELITSQKLQHLPDGCEVINEKEQLEGWRTLLKKENGISNNQLLQSIIQQSEIKNFSEQLPTMQEIYVSAVEAHLHKQTN